MLQLFAYVVLGIIAMLILRAMIKRFIISLFLNFILILFGVFIKPRQAEPHKPMSGLNAAIARAA